MAAIDQNNEAGTWEQLDAPPAAADFDLSLDPVFQLSRLSHYTLARKRAAEAPPARSFRISKDSADPGHAYWLVTLFTLGFLTPLFFARDCPPLVAALFALIPLGWQVYQHHREHLLIDDASIVHRYSLGRLRWERRLALADIGGPLEVSFRKINRSISCYQLKISGSRRTLHVGRWDWAVAQWVAKVVQREIAVRAPSVAASIAVPPDSDPVQALRHADLSDDVWAKDSPWSLELQHDEHGRQVVLCLAPPPDIAGAIRGLATTLLLSLVFFWLTSWKVVLAWVPIALVLNCIPLWANPREIWRLSADAIEHQRSFPWRRIVRQKLTGLVTMEFVKHAWIHPFTTRSLPNGHLILRDSSGKALIRLSGLKDNEAVDIIRTLEEVPGERYRLHRGP